MFAKHLIAVIGLALATSARASEADENYSWQVYESRDSVAIVYGTPRSDDVILVLNCERRTGQVHVNPYLGTRGVRKNEAATITLSSRGGTVRIPARPVFRALDGTFLVEGVTPYAPTLPIVLEAPGVLVIQIPGLRESVPLDEASAFAADRFRALCPVPG